jgi:hypothetical protein
MDPVKVVIFVAAFLLLLLLGKKLSSHGESYASTLPPGALHPQPVESDGDEPTLVGADLPFPVNLPEIESDADGKYNRPEFLNYYFGKLDLRAGPESPESFCDDFYVEIRDVGNSHSMLYTFVVATPAGLGAVLSKERLPALYLEEQVIIVPRWDLKAILNAAVQEIMKAYQEQVSVPEGEHALPDSDKSA